MSRRRILLSILLLVLLLLGWLLFDAYCDDAISAQNFVKINPGMSRAEVESLFRGPPRIICGKAADDGWHRPAGVRPRVWQSAEGKFTIYFDGNDRVVAVRSQSVTAEEPWLQQLWRRIKSWFQSL